eukprot:m.283854 g.283854  ORF g.283854 m.283854 type:complete len:1004 (-) comp15759_c0_seq3:218-3229(-)
MDNPSQPPPQQASGGSEVKPRKSKRRNRGKRQQNGAAACEGEPTTAAASTIQSVKASTRTATRTATRVATRPRRQKTEEKQEAAVAASASRVEQSDTSAPGTPQERAGSQSKPSRNRQRHQRKSQKTAGNLREKQGDRHQPFSTQLSADAQEFVPSQSFIAQPTSVTTHTPGGAAVKKQARRRQPRRARADKEQRAASGSEGEPIGHKTRQPAQTQSFLQDNPDSLAARLTHELMDERYECMICLDNVKRDDFVWSCRECYRVMHAECIKEWAQSSGADGGKAKRGGAQKVLWRCPGCQHTVPFVPGAPKCFCTNNRQPRRWHPTGPAPHSCGEVCGKRRSTNGHQCQHTCSDLCHPGPCAPCQVTVSRRCFCNKESKPMLCGSASRSFSCQQTCGRKLNCGQHTCEKDCHDGPCDPCDVQVTLTCRCQKNVRQVTCTDSTPKTFRCDEPCDKPLECGNHNCTMVCHTGSCGACKFSPDLVTRCPCGNMVLRALQDVPRTSCLDPIPTCLGTCNKTLECGHRCPKRCHDGPCPDCKLQTTVTCVCGSTNVKRRCHEARAAAGAPLRCDRPCNARLNCGRHQCKEICCVAKCLAGEHPSEHECHSVCNRKLKCGCRCDHPCHRGACPPCGRFSLEPLFCTCGKTSVPPPVPCGFPRPICREPCSREHPCGHPATHPCHYDETCAPCTVHAPRMCVGNHQEVMGPCHVRNRYCTRPCGKVLACGLHTCPVFCHSGSCEEKLKQQRGLRGVPFNPAANATSAWFEGEEEESEQGPSVPQLTAPSCHLKCKKLRPCGHPCAAECHPGIECPPLPCKVRIHRKCQCGYLKMTGPCGFGAVSAAARFGRTEPEDFFVKSLPIPCSAECARHQRNAKLAGALKIDIEKAAGPPIEFTDGLLDAARTRPDFIRSVETSIEQFVCDKMLRQLRLPVMKSSDRKLAHELAELYGIGSESEDPEPHRSVVLYKVPILTPRLIRPPLSEIASIGGVTTSHAVPPSGRPRLKLTLD